MVERKTLIESVIVAFIGIFAGSLSIDFLVSVFLNPNVTIDLSIDDKNKNQFTVNVKNIGSTPANNLILSIFSPTDILTHSISNTENYTKEIQEKSTLKLYTPRFAQGSGSLIEIKLEVKNDTNLYNSAYDAYVTHDKGSTMISKNVITPPPKNDIQSQISEFSEKYTASSYYLIIFLIIGILFVILIVVFSTKEAKVT